ncbi:MAG: lipase [Verrucomicrobiales bacterium]|nr:lipase [Verrucomicrobiales bacterium]
MKPIHIAIVAAVLTAGCASRTAQTIDQNAAMFFTSRVEHDVVYRTVNGKDLHLSLYLPDIFLGEDPWWANDKKGKKPTLFHIHGGGWVEGSKDQILINQLPYLSRDWVVVCINYRLAKDGKAPAAVEDCLAALDWIHSNAEKYDIDTDRIVVSGGSAGGHLALMTGMLRKGDELCDGKLKVGDSKKIAAIVNWYGVTDFSINRHPSEWFGNNIDTEEYVRTLSPINYVREGVAPVITIHGTEDAAVPYVQAVNMHKKLREVGTKERLHTIKGKKHGDFTPEELTQIYQEIWEFLESVGVKTTVD